MEIINRISGPLSEPWVAWLMLFLLALLLLANRFRPGMIHTSFLTLFSAKERDSIFVQSSIDIRGQVLAFIYEVSVIALSAYLVCFTAGQFAFVTYMKILGVVIGVFALKFLLSAYLSFVYFDSSTFSMCLSQYSSLLMAVLSAAYPLLLVALFVPQVSRTAVLVMAVALLSFFFVCLLVKLFRIFFKDLLACFYILLYLCTLEFLPLALIMFGALRLV